MDPILWLLIAVCFIILLYIKKNNPDKNKSIADKLLDLINEMVEDKALLKALFELIIKISNHQISGSDKKQVVLKILGEEHNNMNLFIIKRVIDLIVNYLKLTGKINGHKDYTGVKIEKS